MSTKPCPQCGSAVPLQARFCGQCGHTFTPRTLDDATADPAPGPGPAPRPHAGMPTALGGHAQMAPSPGLGGGAPPPPPKPTPSQPAFQGMKTQLGRAEEPPPVKPPTFGKTLFDPAPYGAGKSSASAQANDETTQVLNQQPSDRPTPMVPAPGPGSEQTRVAAPIAPPPPSERTAVAPPPKPQKLAQTMNDPLVAQRARDMVKDAQAARAAIAPPDDFGPGPASEPYANIQDDPPPNVGPSSVTEPRGIPQKAVAAALAEKPGPVFGKTLVLGGVSAAEVIAQANAASSSAAGAASSPAAATAQPPPQPGLDEKTARFQPGLVADAASPMSRSVVAPANTPPFPSSPQQPPSRPSQPQMPQTMMMQQREPAVSPQPMQGTLAMQSSMQAPQAMQSIKTPVQAMTPVQPQVVQQPPSPQPHPAPANPPSVQSAPIQVAPVHVANPSAPPLEPPPRNEPAPPPQGQLAGTMAIGLNPGSDKQTMLGMPAVELPPSSQPPQQQQQHHQQGGPQGGPMSPQQAVAAAFAPAMKTMMGVAMPGIAPTHENPPPGGPPGLPAGAPPVERLGTLQGIAAIPQQQQRPPTQPLHQQQAPQQSQQQTPPAPPIVPPPAPLIHEPIPEKPSQGQKKGVPAIAVVGIVFLLVVLIGGAAAYIMIRQGGPLVAQPQLDETGKESLKIKCDSCPDGTVISLGASSTTVKGASAVLPLPAPLSIGDNDLELNIDRPASGRDETVKIHVPVAYRVKADLSSLTPAAGSTDAPAVTVRVEAVAGTEVTVDGKPVTLDASGKGSQAIDVSAEVLGQSDDQKAIDKKIPFTIKSKGKPAAETGQLVVRAAVMPLHIDAPGTELYTDRPTAAVAGQTKPAGTLTIDGQPVTLDAQGRFGVRVELPPEGEKTITIVANSPPLAPRTMRARIVRVASFDAGAKALDAKTPMPFDQYGGTDAASKVGKLVVVDGEIVETRVQQGHTVMLVEEKKACPAGSAAGACIVRIVHGDELKAARGDIVHAYGRIEGTVSSGGKTIPDIEGVLVQSTPGKPAGKK